MVTVQQDNYYGMTTAEIVWVTLYSIAFLLGLFGIALTLFNAVVDYFCDRRNKK